MAGGQIPAHRAGVTDLDRGDGAAHHPALQAGTDGFNLR